MQRFVLFNFQLQDEAGALWRAEYPSFKMQKLLEFHAGPIIGVASSPLGYELASAGSDGTVSLSIIVIVFRDIKGLLLARSAS